MENYDYIQKNLSDLISEIRSMSDKVTLVAVTKSGSDDELLALCEAGVTDVGENRPGELARRGPDRFRRLRRCRHHASRPSR